MESRKPRVETVRVPSEVDLRVLCWDGRPPGFVLIHGLASNARLWVGVASALSGTGAAQAGADSDRTGPAVTAVDLRGHGESAVPASGYDTATAAADVAVVIKSLGLDRPVVVGQSWGGNVVVELAATEPSLIGAIALVDGGWISLRDTFDSWAAVLQKLSPPDQGDHRWSDISAMMRAAHPDWADWAIEATMANLRERADGSVRARLARNHHLSILRSMWDHSINERYAAVTVPSLLISAGQRSGPQLAAVDRAAAELPGSDVRWYEGADHDVHAQHPDQLAADLLAFYERAGAAATVVEGR